LTALPSRVIRGLGFREDDRGFSAAVTMLTRIPEERLIALLNLASRVELVIPGQFGIESRVPGYRMSLGIEGYMPSIILNLWDFARDDAGAWFTRERATVAIRMEREGGAEPWDVPLFAVDVWSSSGVNYGCKVDCWGEPRLLEEVRAELTRDWS
jgi:hypothetical protein